MLLKQKDDDDEGNEETVKEKVKYLTICFLMDSHNKEYSIKQSINLRKEFEIILNMVFFKEM